jgi:hypothetical protein
MAAHRDTTKTAFWLKSEVMAYGNEWSRMTFYSGVAMLVELPPWHSAERASAITAVE